MNNNQIKKIIKILRLINKFKIIYKIFVNRVKKIMRFSDPMSLQANNKKMNFKNLRQCGCKQNKQKKRKNKKQQSQILKMNSGLNRFKNTKYVIKS